MEKEKLDTLYLKGHIYFDALTKEWINFFDNVKDSGEYRTKSRQWLKKNNIKPKPENSCHINYNKKIVEIWNFDYTDVILNYGK